MNDVDSGIRVIDMNDVDSGIRVIDMNDVMTLCLSLFVLFAQESGSLIRWCPVTGHRESGGPQLWR